MPRCDICYMEYLVLFSISERTDASPKRYRETLFEFLDRSSCPEVVAVRNLLEAEFAGYIELEKQELRARLKSRRDREFHAACFELLLYGMLARQGYRLEAHPDPGNGTKNRPDFLVTSPKGESFFLEAVMAAEMRDAQADAMRDDVLDALDRTPHANFYLDIIHSGSPASQPPITRLRNYVQRWLDGLDVDVATAALAANGLEALPRGYWEHDGWQLELRAIPKKGNRGKLDRLIGLLSSGAQWIDLKSPIRRAIRFKGGRYGNLPLPLVIAVNVDAFYLREHDEIEALFGSEGIAISENGIRPIRQADGAWHDGCRPRSTRVSAAWLFNDVSYWSLAGRRQTLYINPWASTPLGAALDFLPIARVVDGVLKTFEGLSPGQAYGLR